MLLGFYFLGINMYNSLSFEPKKYHLSIALDYDETFTADRELWTLFVFAAINKGHKVTFVTYRHESLNNADIITDAKQLGIEIVFTEGKQKSTCFKADIWIDDSPITVPSIEAMGEFYDNQL